MALSTANPAEIAALLPPWRRLNRQPRPVRHPPNAAMFRITNGRHALIVEQAGRIAVYADRPDMFPVCQSSVVVPLHQVTDLVHMRAGK
ncbi:hypothetical protein [Streptomyces sp. NPDC006996]|uniref:hypothetical protein n=1 Tax=Streptomyces sp. NPDC006996 TaxID=3156908 RepID=UPI0034057C67